MENFNSTLEEIYLNYDTLEMMKEDTNHSDILKMFEDELEYPSDLTESLMNFKKSFLKSVVMRIKLKMNQKTKPSEIKNDLISYNESLSPLLEKLLSNNKFTDTYNEMKSSKKTETKKEVVVEEETTSIDTEFLDSFLEDYVTKTDDAKDVLKISTLQEFLDDHCEENSHSNYSKNDFKKYLSDRWGKSTNSSYKGYKVNEDDEESE